MLEETLNRSRYETGKKRIVLLNLMFFQVILLIGLTQANSGGVIDYILDSPAKEIGTDLIVTADSPSTYYGGFSWGAVGISGTRGYYGLQSEGPGNPYGRHLHLTIWDAPDGSQARIVSVGDGVVWKRDSSEGSAIICTYNTNWIPNHLYKLLVNLTNTGTSTLYKAYFYNYTSSELKHIATIEYPENGISIQAIASFLEDFGYHADCLDASYRSVMYGNGYKILSDGLKVNLCEARYSPSGSDCPERNGVAYGNYFKIESGVGAVEQTPPGSTLSIICDTSTKTYWGFDLDLEEWERIGTVRPWANYSLNEAVKWYNQWAECNGVVVMDACIWPENGISASTGIINLVKLPASASMISVNCTKDAYDGGLDVSLIDADGIEHQLGNEVLISGEKKILKFSLSNWAGQTVMLVIRAYGACSTGDCDPGNCCCFFEYVGVNSVKIESNLMDAIGVFRNGPWYLDYNGNRVWDPASGDVSFWFGTSGDMPVAGDWNGDGTDEIGVFRNGPWYLDYNGNRVWDPASGDMSFWFGTSGDKPVSGQWGGDWLPCV